MGWSETPAAGVNNLNGGAATTSIPTARAQLPKMAPEGRCTPLQVPYYFPGCGSASCKNRQHAQPYGPALQRISKNTRQKAASGAAAVGTSQAEGNPRRLTSRPELVPVHEHGRELAVVALRQEVLELRHRRDGRR